MSTKTTFKRIALVAVAALGLGVLSVAPSSAVVLPGAGTNTLTAVSSSTTITAKTATLPVDGTNGSFVLPPLMTQPMVLATPANEFQVSAIGSATGPALVYITPVGNQS